jgi:NosR/NirI family transcriptional regulator, nitrous oxide reductase regulator
LRLVFAATVVALAALPAESQSVRDPALLEQLEQIFPDAASFSEKSGSPPHFKAFGSASSGGEPALLGFVFWTTELEPLERGYDGPIKMLVGIDTTGIIKGAIVTEHNEPYGYFSIDLPEFTEQFEDKNIRDRFQVGADVDAVARATITITSASRAVRNSARRIARAYLKPPEAARPQP